MRSKGIYERGDIFLTAIRSWLSDSLEEISQSWHSERNSIYKTFYRKYAKTGSIRGGS